MRRPLSSEKNTPLYQQYEDYVGAMRNRGGMTEEKSPVLAGRALSSLRKACLSKVRYFTARPGGRQLMPRKHLSHAHHHNDHFFQQTTNIAPPPHAGFCVLTRSSFSLILAGVSFLA
jgi:hypothetical protein